MPRHQSPRTIALGEDRSGTAPESGVRVAIRGNITPGFLAVDLAGTGRQAAG
jgi:hypothetical protein